MTYALILFSMASIYFAAGLLLLNGIFKLRRGKNREPLGASVVLAVRDGADTIGDCLSNLMAQSYPQEAYEVLVVDDGSTDGTWDILEASKEKHPSLKIVRATEGFGRIAGKQNALAQGIALAQGEIILHTDADGLVPRRWVERVVSHFEPEVGLVVGFALPEKSPGLFAPIRSSDFLFLQAVAAGFAGYGKPLSAIGKNISYRKSAYQEVGGFERMGLQLNEDMALIQKIHRETDWQTAFMQGADACVKMQGTASLSAFLEQRKRWLAAGFRSHPALFATLAFVFWTHVMLLASALFLGSLPALLVYYSYLVVASANFMLIAQGACMTRRYDLILTFPMFQAFFWIYTTLLGFGMLTPGKRKIMWRGRTY
ncbi:MAG: glycosyltransferase [Candidatus Latescibacterota bacterium]